MKSQVKEIEVKARVKDFDNLIKNLKKLGCKLSKPINQHDYGYLKNGVKFEEFKKGTHTLRIRVEDKRNIFTIKVRQEIELSAVEKEVEIEDVETMKEILKLIGYYEIMQIVKVRRKCKYKNYEICLDQVKGLGNFIEVEKMSAEDGEKVQEELFKFLETLGIKREDREKRGYDTLTYYKNKGRII